MNIAVTGASGFIGGATVRSLARSGHSVCALVRKRSNVDALQPLQGVTVKHVDFEDSDSLSAALAGVTGIIHAGGPGIAECVRYGLSDREGISPLVDAAQRTGCSRFVYLSTVKARPPRIGGIPQSKLTDVYGRRKRAEEVVVSSADVLQWTIVRAAAVYGPGDRKLLSAFKLASRGFVPCLKSASCGRFSLVHVEDLSTFLTSLSTGTGFVQNTVEIGSDKTLTWNDLILILAEPSAKKVLLPTWTLRTIGILGNCMARFNASLQVVAPRIADLTIYDWGVIPSSNLSQAVTTDLTEGLLRTRDWYRRMSWLV